MGEVYDILQEVTRNNLLKPVLVRNVLRKKHEDKAVVAKIEML